MLWMFGWKQWILLLSYVMQWKKITSDESSNTDHKEKTPGRIKHDAQNFNIIVKWFQSHSSFTIATDLVCLDWGLVDGKDIVTGDNVESISATIQKELSRKLFSERRFKRKAQITNL